MCQLGNSNTSGWTPLLTMSYLSFDDKMFKMIENFINNKIFSNSNTCKTINIGSFWWVSNIQVTPQKWLQNGQKLSYREVSDQFVILKTRATR